MSSKSKYYFVFIIKFIVIVLFLNTNINAQIKLHWVSIYSGPGLSYDYAKDLVLDSSKNLMVTGVSNNDILTVKYNSSGQQIWESRYDGSAQLYDSPAGIIKDHVGNIIIAGVTYTPQSENIVLIKYLPPGQMDWIRIFEGKSDRSEICYGLASDNMGNIYVAGSEGDTATGNLFLLLKYDTYGSLIWKRNYNRLYNITSDNKVSICLDHQQNVYLTGNGVGNTFSEDYVTLKYDSSGNLLWNAKYNGTGFSGDRPLGIVADNNLNVYVTGASPGLGTGNDFVTIKYNSSGNQQWLQRYNSSLNGYDNAYLISFDSSGYIYVCGSEQTINLNDICLIKYDLDGNLIWNTTYNGPFDLSDSPSDMKLDAYGNIYITGITLRESGFGDEDIVTLKYNSSGSLIWNDIFNNQYNRSDVSRKLVLDNSNIYITGFRTTGGGIGNYDYQTINYTDIIGINNNQSNAVQNYSLYQNYPNPFNPVTMIGFNIQKTSFAKLTIYDVLGKEVSELVNGKFNPGKYEVSWEADDYESGIYFYKLEAENFSQSKRMILLK